MRILANPVEYSMYTLTVGDFVDSGDSILLGVQNDMIRTVRLRNFRFLRRRCCTNDSRTARFSIRGEQEPKAACDGMDEDDIALLDVVRLGHESDDRQTWMQVSWLSWPMFALILDVP